ncbi:MAG: type 2 lanthipeptide synthetase LanM family protein [Beijerinckiaceae bacterium]
MPTMEGEACELSGDELASIARNASSLWERVSHGISGPSSGPASKKIDAQLKAWLETAAEGDANRFEERLFYDQLDLQKARAQLAMLSDATELPQWVHILNDVLKRVPSFSKTALDPTLCETCEFLSQGAPIPFEELLLPFIAAARDMLTSVTAGECSALTRKASTSVERALLSRLSDMSSRVLLVEFRTFLASQQLSGSGYRAPTVARHPRGSYLRFVEEIYRASWAPLFEEYCVLSRLMATALLQWVETIAEFLERLERDLPAIRHTFFGDQDVGKITDVKIDLSDRHHDGRTVIALEFDCGAKLIYKPRSLDLEAEYFRFTDWVSDLGATLPFRHLKTLERNGYGWVEFVESLPCANEDEVRRFYQRMGMFLCLVYAFNGMDFHFENLIACGEHPVPVDLETIFHPLREDPSDNNAGDALAKRLRLSVLQTHLLPRPKKLDNHYYDISAIAGGAEQQNKFELLAWKEVNTDDMDYSIADIEPQRLGNLPRLNDSYVSPDDYVGEMTDGFRQMYRLLFNHREDLLAEGSPFHLLFQHEGRFIFRPTSFYLSVWKRALNPSYLRDGINFSIQLDILAPYFLAGRNIAKFWPLLREERNALLSGDVPRFTARGNANFLTLASGEILSDCFVDSAWSQARQKIRSFSEDDLQWQLSLITNSMESRDTIRLTRPAAKNEPVDWGASAPLLSKKQLLESATVLAREIVRNAVYSENDEPSWLVLNYLPSAERFALEAIDLDLYNGRCGLALFFAALEKALPGWGHGEIAYDVLAHVRRWLARAGDREIKSLGLGGYVGAPSLAYSLMRIGTLLDDDELLMEAARVVSFIDRKQIDSDRLINVIAGSAGTILSLLACYKTIGRPEMLDMAVACGKHLLEKREATNSGFRTWASSRGRYLTGFAHGAGGIAYALLRLYEATGERDFLSAAEEAIDFEGSEFVPEENNWPDKREIKNNGKAPARRAFRVTWCNGASGIGLARLGGLGILDSPSIRRDIRGALSTTSNCGLMPRDHLCCGNCGLIETLLVAGSRLSEPELTQQALRLASAMVARAERKHKFGVTLGSGFLIPTLLQGAAGVGYELLRVACPDQIPSLLLLE